FEQSMELTFQHPELRRQWLRAFARSLQKHFLGSTPARAPNLIAVLHESPTTRQTAHKLVQRLQSLGEGICVLCETDAWRALPNVRFRALSEGGRPLELNDIRQQIAEWNQAKRILIEVDAGQNREWIERLLEVADRVLWFAQSSEA